jgi:hypothetical protein
VGLPALQRAHIDAGDFAGALQPCAGLVCFIDIPGQALAIFETDHSALYGRLPCGKQVFDALAWRN